MDRKNTTRQIYDQAVGPARGILSQPIPPGVFSHARRAPAPDLLPWIQHYWQVSWHLPTSATHTVHSLPHPNIQLVFARDGNLIHGIHPRLFTKTLVGKESVFGVKFRAGGFQPFYRRDVSSLRGRTVPAHSVFGVEINKLLVGQQTIEQKIEALDAFFKSLLHNTPPPEFDATHAAKLCEDSPAIRTVADLAAIIGSSERSLQRLFRQHIGATPKWVIRRYRIHELVERINNRMPGEKIDWATTALDLGYFDQSHMIRDFRSLTGFTPATN